VGALEAHDSLDRINDDDSCWVPRNVAHELCSREPGRRTVLDGRAGHAVQQACNRGCDAVRTAWQISRHLQQRISMFMGGGRQGSLWEDEGGGDGVAVLRDRNGWHIPVATWASTVCGHSLLPS